MLGPFMMAINPYRALLFSRPVQEWPMNNKAVKGATPPGSERGHTEILRGIGNRIRQARLRRGLSLQIAHRIRDRADIKLDPSRLSRIERGQAELRLRTLLALAD